jgi:hypothetical protein
VFVIWHVPELSQVVGVDWVPALHVVPREAQLVPAGAKAQAPLPLQST